MQIIINAGGMGSRLWPYSTNQKPKQFVPLVNDTSFLRQTYDRLVSEFDPSQIWVNTNAKFKQLVIDQLPIDFDNSHILTEPEKRDNFAAIVSHAAVVSHFVGESEPLVFVHADHLIQPDDWATFNHALKLAAATVESNQYDIVTAGVRPKFPNTQLGYIEIEKSEFETSFEKAVKVKMFKEKPDQETAQSFLNEGNFLWNLGYFSFSFESLMKNVERFHPDIYDVFKLMQNSGEIHPDHYSSIPKIAFDYAIAEKTDSLGVVGIDIDWEDIGNWEVAAKYLPEIQNDADHLQIGGENNKVKSTTPNRKVAFVGVSGLVLVESEEGILVIDPTVSAKVKNVAEYFEKRQLPQEEK